MRKGGELETARQFDGKGGRRYTTSMDSQERIAGWLEKMSVAGFAVGLFQEKPLLGFSFGFLFLVGSLYLTRDRE